MSNLEFSKTDRLFRVSCCMAGIPATARQASKWRRGMGIALRYREDANLLITLGE
jgi:hypothetical protein